MKHFIESSTLEFKEDIPQNDQIVQTVIAFSNTHGGKLLIGVNNHGKIVGLNEKKVGSLMERLSQIIHDSIHPTLMPDIHLERINQLPIIVIDIAPGIHRPYYKKSLGNMNGVYIRIGPRTIKASIEQIHELQWKSKGYSFDQTPEYKGTMEDLDNKKVKSFLSSRIYHSKKSIKLTSELLKLYFLSFQEGDRTYPTKAAILLFGTNTNLIYPDNIILCTRFVGNSGRNAKDTMDCSGDLFSQFELAYDFILSHLQKGHIIGDKKRKAHYDIPIMAIREILINAIVHRDYSMNSPIKIAIYDDRIEFFSPGQIPGPIHIDDLKNGLTYIRNTAISKCFREAGLIEKLGTGIPTTFELYEKENLNDPQFISNGPYVKVILPRTKKTSTQTFNGWEEQLEILIDANPEITVKMVIEKLQCSRITASRLLKKLVTKKRLRSFGKGPATKYIK